MNKKGFTTIELIVSFVMVVILLASLIGFTINYRDKVRQEEIISQLYDFKNTITKIVYDDIISLNYSNASLCVGIDNCVVFTDESKNSHTLKVENICECENMSDCSLNKCGVYIVYDGVKYLLPDSDLNKYYKDSNNNIEVIESASNLTSFKLNTYNNSIYSLKMTFNHYRMDKDLEIMLTIN